MTIHLVNGTSELLRCFRVVAKFGVPPASMPDYLVLVGDNSDRVPGLAGWGPKSAATLGSNRQAAVRFKQLATLRTDVQLFESVDELVWRGPTPALPAVRRRLAQYD